MGNSGGMCSRSGMSRELQDQDARSLAPAQLCSAPRIVLAPLSRLGHSLRFSGEGLFSGRRSSRHGTLSSSSNVFVFSTTREERAYALRLFCRTLCSISSAWTACVFRSRYHVAPLVACAHRTPCDVPVTRLPCNTPPDRQSLMFHYWDTDDVEDREWPRGK